MIFYQPFGTLFLSLFVGLTVPGMAASALRKSSRDLHQEDFSVSKDTWNKDATPQTKRLLFPTAKLDFSAFSPGDVVTDLGDGISVVANTRKSRKAPYIAGQAMIFDSSNPTGGDEDLGTPNMSFGGPGLGNAGKKGKLFANMVAQGNVLIVSKTNDHTNPDDNEFGGGLYFYFDPPRYIDSIGLLDNDEGAIFTTVTSDGDSSVIFNYVGGNNSFEDVGIGKPEVKQLSVEFEGSGAISYIRFKKVKCQVKSLTCFDKLKAGDVVSDLGNGLTVEAYDAKGNKTKAMIFNTLDPTGDDFDLGTPNEDFGGRGTGDAGKKGKLFANSRPRGKAVIISEDGITTNPNDSASGGIIVFYFDKPTYIDSIGLLDNDEGVIFGITCKDGGVSYIHNWNGGNNSFEMVKIAKPGVIQITVVQLGSGAITDINTCA